MESSHIVKLAICEFTVRGHKNRGPVPRRPNKFADRVYVDCNPGVVQDTAS